MVVKRLSKSKENISEKKSLNQAILSWFAFNLHLSTCSQKFSMILIGWGGGQVVKLNLTVWT